MKQQIADRISKNLENFFKEKGISPEINPTRPPDPSKGDYTLNLAMPLGKILKKPPLLIAETIAEILAEDKKTFESVEAVKPGFINMRLANSFLEDQFDSFVSSPSLLEASKSETPKRVIVDYSSVNIAKQMHVGHLRSTIIGDVIARIIESLGDKVIAQNHLGDWGVPMAMVIRKAESAIDKAIAENQNPEDVLDTPMLEAFYKEATAECKSDPVEAAACHDYLIRLQNQEQKLVDYWQIIKKVSMRDVYKIYKLLGVRLEPENERGESFYADMLPEIVEKIQQKGLIEISDGAKCVFLDEFKAKDGTPLPVIIQKSDGGYNYATFDLAALHYRTNTLKADRIIYVTDARQALHFKQVFAVARKAGLVPEKVMLEHVTFGSILGEDNKPLKTRDGENVKLAELLDEAIKAAYQVVDDKNNTLPEEYKQQVAKMTGIGAVKYADMAQNRNNDYVFSFERMLALSGNTAPYLQYAHARICSIFRKTDFIPSDAKVIISAPEEKELILKAMEFPLTVKTVSEDLKPHTLCAYLYDLSTLFSSFYTNCRILDCENENQKHSRLALSRAIQRIIKKGLGLLGIEAPEEM